MQNLQADVLKIVRSDNYYFLRLCLLTDHIAYVVLINKQYKITQ